jgi:4-amino-4-deoxy-L-arabinose transferase-like glycosyltransferase
MTWQRLRSFFSSDLGILLLLALARVLIQTFTNGQYGFHRDELATIDDARHLALGYVAYPPLTPLIARGALELFGPSLIGLRFFSVLAQAAGMVLVGLMARELGARRKTQVLAALLAGTTPVSLVSGSLFQYVSFDYLWWVLIAYCTLRLLKSDNPRWWLAIGAAIGLGALTKYTIAILIAGLIVGLLLSHARRYLLSPWLWAGAGIAVLLVLPNLIWQIQHNFVSIEFTSSIHARDIHWGRTNSFFIDQIKLILNLLTILLVFGGLYFYLFSAKGRAYRAMGWMFIVPLVLFVALQGRGYYLMPAYPMLIAAGAVWGEQLLDRLAPALARSIWRVAWGLTAVCAITFALLLFPVWPINSAMWGISSSLNSEVNEEVGWTDLTQTVAAIYAKIPEAEKPSTGILAANYGEAGAINLYGPAYHLPQAISGINSFWLYGYGDPPPQTLIVVGLDRTLADRFFATCELAGTNTNPYGVKNEESTSHPDIFLCRQLRQPWPEFWKNFRYFG